MNPILYRQTQNIIKKRGKKLQEKKPPKQKEEKMETEENYRPGKPITRHTTTVWIKSIVGNFQQTLTQ